MQASRQLLMQPDLVATWVSSAWIQKHYGIFCDWLRVGWTPPYKDFGRELALIMLRRRKDTRIGGRRARTMYLVASDVGAGTVTSGGDGGGPRRVASSG